MFRTLYSKLAAVLLGLFVLVGAAAIFGTLHLFSLYHLESNQKLNRTLAAHLAEQNKLAHVADADTDRLRSLFDMQMIVNPAIQIYLLGPDGEVVAFSADPDEVKTRHVALGPIRSFLAGEGNFPILGDDPRHPGARTIFSVASIPASGAAEGYLYVVLGSPQQESVGHLLSQSYAVQIAASVAGMSLLFAFLVGLIIFAVITRKLERLAAGMAQFQAADFTQRPELPPLAEGHYGDEIDRLGLTFRELANRMVTQVQKLKQTDVLRRELVANVSHDLKTPLASLQGYVDTLLLKDDTLSPEERRNYLGVAARSCERLGKLVADLIELAKLDAHEVLPQREAFSPGELLQDVAQKFEIKAQQREVRLEMRIPERISYVYGDIGLIERVLDNLIGNALAHTDPGGCVCLGLKPEGEAVVVEVTDTGHGIPEQDLPHVFERFYRANTGSWEQGGHAGLGLAITKSILDLHGSRMRVESRVGIGTSFAFSLPVAA
jgi:signal transduction histidine kinase